MVQFALHAVERVNVLDVFPSRTVGNQQETDFIFTDVQGRIHPIQTFEKPVTIEQAFDELLASSFAATSNCAIAPVVFDMDGDQPIIHSIKAFPNTVTAGTVIEKARRQEKMKGARGDAEIREWVHLVDTDNRNLPLADMEQVLFSKTIGSVSRLLPLLNWLGGSDTDTRNFILDRDALLAQLSGRGGAALPMYLCDFSDNDLAHGFNNGVNPNITTDINRRPFSDLANFMREWRSMLDLERRLVKVLPEPDPSQHEEQAKLTPLMNPIFAPHLDVPAIEESMRTITAFKNDAIANKVEQIVNGMAAMMHNAADVERLARYAEYKAGVLMMRRNLLVAHMTPLLAAAATDKPEGNPFLSLGNAVDTELGRIKAAKAATRPKPKAKKDKGGQKPET